MTKTGGAFDTPCGDERVTPPFRIIARLDVKGPNVVKGIQFEGLKKIGDPEKLALKYFEAGADEIYLEDTVASLYGRNNLIEVVASATREVFVPFTVGGGVRTPSDAYDLLRAGADKVSVNSAAVARPALIQELAKEFGSQCVVVSIQAKSRGGKWEVFVENGREPTGLEVISWARHAQDLGAGEILLTSVDDDGTMKGLAYELIEELSPFMSVPFVVSGGAGEASHVARISTLPSVDGAAVASVLHFNRSSIPEIKAAILNVGGTVREVGGD